MKRSKTSKNRSQTHNLVFLNCIAVIAVILALTMAIVSYVLRTDAVYADEQNTVIEAEEQHTVIETEEQNTETAAEEPEIKGTTEQEQKRVEMESDSNNEAEEPIYDTTAPTLKFTTDGYFYIKSENGTDQYFIYTGTPVVYDDKNASSENYKFEMNLTISDENFDGADYLNQLKKCGINNVIFTHKENSTDYEYTFTWIKEAGTVQQISLSLPLIADESGNTPESGKESIYGLNNTMAVNTVTVTSGKAELSFLYDAQPPYTKEDSDIMEITLEGDSFTGFDSAETFYHTITAAIVPSDGEGTGIKEAYYWIEGNDGFVDVSATSGNPIQLTSVNGTFSSGELHINADKEKNSLYFCVKAVDNVGNIHISYKAFNVDTLAPRVTITFDNNDVRNEIYFKEKRTASICVEDLNFEESKSNIITAQIDEAYDSKAETVEWKTEGSISKSTVVFKKDGTYKFRLSSVNIPGKDIEESDDSIVDKAGNTCSEIDYYNRISKQENSAPNEFVIDTIKPVINISFDDSRNKDEEYAGEVKTGKEYYDGPCRADISILEHNFKEDNVSVKQTAGLDEEGDIEIPEISGNKFSETYDQHTAVINYDNDGTYTLNIECSDLAGNKAEPYESNLFTIDTITPVTELFIPVGAEKNSNGNTKYFCSGQEIGFRIRERNLDKAGSYVTYKINGTAYRKTIDELVETENFKFIKKSKLYSWTLPVTDGQTVSDFSVYAIDYSEHTARQTDQYNYIVDTTAPSVTVSITGREIEGYFINNGKVYINFQSNAIGESGNSALSSSKKVTLKAIITDKNIQANSNSGFKYAYVVKTKLNDGSFTGICNCINEEQSAQTAVFTKTLTVASDTSGTLIIDLQITDLAGNNASKIMYGGTLKSNTDGQSAYKLTKGHMTGSITADQERPSCVNDEKKTPVITLKPQSERVGTVTNTYGKTVDLYASDMKYALKVYDPVYTDENGVEQYSGLAKVEWNVSSDKAGLITGSGSRSFSGQQSADVTLPVSINGTGETNNIIVSIKVTDRAGNITTYKHYLAMDNQPPEVKISYDNNSVRNARYFKSDRILTITVEDLNFNSSGTRVTTEKNMSGWSRSGNVYTATVYYNTDGDYTFDMSSADQAGNQARIDYTNKGKNAVPTSFTVDKTDPVITVSFDNNSARNGKYYRSDRTATVSVNEHNFNADEVMISQTASLGSQNIKIPSVNVFKGINDVHSASILYDLDGDYTMTVNYTDLAGNQAQEVNISEFTIDKTAPVAEITGVKNGQAYIGSVNAIISMTDTNFNANEYSITCYTSRIDGRTRQDVTGSENPIRNGIAFRLDDPAVTKDNDGIYELFAEVTDLAGNTYKTSTLTYSVNRFGSVYTANEETTAFLKDPYSNTIPVLVFYETNPSRITERTLTFTVNGTTMTLEKGKDYIVKEDHSTGWYQYKYNIRESAFMDMEGNLIPGEYILTLLSTDEASNKNSNRTNESKLDISFILDNEIPTGFIDISGLKEGKAAIKDISTEGTVYWEDNIGVKTVIIKLNGKIYRKLEEDELAESNGVYTVAIAESTEEQKVEALLVDYAGNENTIQSISFFLNSSALVQFIHNTPLFIGTMIAIPAVIAFLIFIIVRKKKQKDELFIGNRPYH